MRRLLPTGLAAVLALAVAGCSGTSDAPSAGHETDAAGSAYCRLSKQAGEQLAILHEDSPTPDDWSALLDTLDRAEQAAPDEIASDLTYVVGAIDELHGVVTTFDVSVPQIGRIGRGSRPPGMSAARASAVMARARELDLFGDAFRQHTAAITRYDRQVCQLD